MAVSKSKLEWYIIIPYMSDPDKSQGGFKYTVIDQGVIYSLNKINIAFKYRKSTICALLLYFLLRIYMFFDLYLYVFNAER